MLIKHSLSYVLARGLPGLISFLAIAIYTRLLSPDEYGKYVLVITSVSLANVVLYQWLRLSLLRFLPVYSQRSNDFVFAVLVCFGAVTILTAAAAVLFLFFVELEDWSVYLWVGLFVLWVTAWFDLNLEVKRSQLNPMGYGVMSAMKALLALLLGGGAVLLGFGVIGILTGLLCALTAVGLLGALNPIWRVAAKAKKVYFKEIFSYGFPLTGIFALAFIINLSDRYMLAALADESSVGLYSAAYDLSQQSIMLIMMIINLAAYPAIVRVLESQGTQAAKEYTKKNATLLLASGLSASVGLACIASNFVSVFLGQEFQKVALTVIPIVAFAAFMDGVRAFHFDLAFQLGKKTTGQIYVMLSAAICNVLLNLVLIPEIGVKGAAWSTFVSYFVALLLSAFLGKKVFDVGFPWREAGKIMLSVLFMALYLLFVNTGYWGNDWVSLLVQVASGGVIFFCSALILNIYSVRVVLGRRYFGKSL